MWKLCLRFHHLHHRFERAEDRVSSFDVLLEQERPHMEHCLQKILDAEPDIVVVEKTVSRVAQVSSRFFTSRNFLSISSSYRSCLEESCRLLFRFFFFLYFVEFLPDPFLFSVQFSSVLFSLCFHRRIFYSRKISPSYLPWVLSRYLDSLELLVLFRQLYLVLSSPFCFFLSLYYFFTSYVCHYPISHFFLCHFFPSCFVCVS